MNNFFPSVILVENLHKTFGKFIALNGLNFSVESGMIHGFIGPNGAGKTTTIKSLLSLIFPDNGKIELFGTNFLSPLSHDKISYFPEQQGFPKKITTYRYLLFLAQVSGLSKPEAILKIEFLM
jgi:ABC-2 type transport system ATP-binding protein